MTDVLRAQLLGLGRHALSAVGAFVIANGWASASTVEFGIGLALAIGGFVASWKSKRPKARKAG